MPLSIKTTNRLGFIILGLSNLSAYCIMLAAAFDLLASAETADEKPESREKTYCNAHSTGTILIANSAPSLLIKIIYPFLLVDVKISYKVIATAILSALAFIFTGWFTSEMFIFAGVICGSLSQGLGEPVFVSSMLIYGDTSFFGWSVGTGIAGILGSVTYAILKAFLSIKAIMMIMLIMPILLLVAFFNIIKPVPFGDFPEEINQRGRLSLDMIEHKPNEKSKDIDESNPESWQPFNFKDKICHFPKLIKYFVPLILVYFAEYFINMGIFELIYYPEITYLDHAAQYRWFLVAYQLGVVISRCSLDFFVIRQIWAMSLLQMLNAILFLAHVFRIVHIPSFYLCILLIIYEGLLGGFTYINTFFRIRREVQSDKLEFSVSTCTIADSIGIVVAGLVAIPFHNSLCKLYNNVTFFGGLVSMSSWKDLIKVYRELIR